MLNPINKHSHISAIKQQNVSTEAEKRPGPSKQSAKKGAKERVSQLSDIYVNLLRSAANHSALFAIFSDQIDINLIYLSMPFKNIFISR